jgi:hypothetical protein
MGVAPGGEWRIGGRQLDGYVAELEALWRGFEATAMPTATPPR